MDTKAPTQEQIRTARRFGFSRCVDHMPEERRKKLLDSYVKQDTRRETNIRKLVSAVTGKDA